MKTKEGPPPPGSEIAMKRMTSHVRLTALLLAGLLLLCLPSCEFVNPTAPSDAIMSISANPLSIELFGGESIITVRIVEADGSTVPDDTIVRFTTTLGRILEQAGTRNGIARVTLVSGSQPGLATVTARSGALPEATVDVKIGATLQSIALSANPSALGPGGGSTTLTAVAFGDDGEPLAGVPITFSADVGTLASGGAVKRTDGNGRVTDTLTTDQTATVTAAAGTVADGNPVSATVTVEVSTNEPPQAQFVVSPINPAIDEQANFNAAASSDDGSIVAFDWDFGDGATASGERVSHRYQSAKIFTVLLVVTDDQGATATASQAVSVGTGKSPTASFVFSPSSPSPGQSVRFDASSSSDPDGEIVEYRWDWGDGSSPTITSGAIANHTFATSGTFTVTLTVRDNADNTATVTANVKVS